MPVQYCLGVLLIVIGFFIEDWLFPSGDVAYTISTASKSATEEEKPDLALPPVPTYNVLVLTGVFFVTAFLAATQDIAVDGWALTLLSKDNLGTRTPLSHSPRVCCSGLVISFLRFLQYHC